MKLREPRPHQLRALDYALKRTRIALFMEMRLGKNLVTIRWARHHKLDRILVVAPNDILDDWRAELLLEGVSYQDIYVLEGSRLQKRAMAEEVDSGWCIVNYEALRPRRFRDKRTGLEDEDSTGEDILNLPWSGIVLDESTAIRTPKANTTRVFLRATGHIMYRAILTGLPNPHSEKDYFTQMAFLNGSFMGTHNYWAWLHQNFSEPNRIYDWEWTPKRGALDHIRSEVHKVAFFLTRKEAGVGETRVHEKRYVHMTPRQLVAYRSVERDFALGKLETKWSTVQAVWLARLAGGMTPDKDNPQWLNRGKITTIINLLKGELAKESVVIWFRFNKELFEVAKELHRANISYTTITGGKKREETLARRQKFQSGKARVILMQMRMGKFGWDLSRADTEIRYSEVYDYELFAQSTSRIVSLAKHVPLLTISLVTKDSIDEDVVDTLNDRHVTSQTFNSRLKERLAASWARRFPERVMLERSARAVKRKMPHEE